jgi:mRNA-degrading endonuclease toxin of MazEF toxin-antitoxin module
MRRGSVYWVNLEPTTPPELGKVRPGVVVSNTVQNERLDSVVVVPLSTRAPEIWPLRFKAQVRGLKSSYVVIPGVRQVSKTRLHELAAQAPTSVMTRIDEALALYLGD